MIPRADAMAHCLQAMLIKLADNLGYADVKAEFEVALEHEERHLLNVRNWLSECVLDSAEV